MSSILPFLRPDPVPVATDVAYDWFPGGCSTAIMRQWRPGEARLCRRCPAERCSARGRDFCMVVAPGYVPAHECRDYRPPPLDAEGRPLAKRGDA